MESLRALGDGVGDAGVGDGFGLQELELGELTGGR
jgi:hypothetical protein